MTIINGLLLGILHGFTQFLPVSTSGHLAIIESLVNMETISGEHAMMGAMLNLGTLLAVVFVFSADLGRMLKYTLAMLGLGSVREDDQPVYQSGRLMFRLVCATLPAVLLIPVYDMVQSLSSSTIFIGAALILNGTALYTAEQIQNGTKTEKGMSLLDAVLIGLCQIVGAIPGFSRMGIAYSAGMVTGLTKPFALRFSLLLAIPACAATVIANLSRAFSYGVDWQNMGGYLTGLAISFGVSIVGLLIADRVLRKHSMRKLAYYSIIAGIVAMILTSIF